jgi:SpoVK/Ycf46/Vps4 family AAA+-type ATPase
MDNFPIVLALARAALSSPNPAIRLQVERLRDALKAAGSEKEAGAVGKLLSSAEQQGKLEPSRVVLSRAALAGEAMTPSVRAPSDRETASPLAEIVHASELRNEAPLVLNDALAPAVSSAIEEWRNLDRLRALGVRAPLNCLLFGAPGTGKTHLAHYIAGELGLPLVIARLDGIISSFLGTTARNIATLFEFANRYQCVLLLDEFDAVAKIRDDPHEVGEIKRVVNTLLQCLDSRSNIGVTIAITNHEQLLDRAVWRRFDVRIHVPKPDFKARLAIVDRYTQSLGLPDVDKKLLAWLTADRSGSEIQTLSNAILRMAALTDPSSFHIADALRLNAQLSADLQGSERQAAIIGEPESLAKLLAEDTDTDFTQLELAHMLQKDQSTISRWLKRSSPPARV